MSFVVHNCGCIRTDRARRSHALADIHTSIHAWSPRVYLVISILLNEQCICLRRRRVFNELRAAAGAYNAHADHYAFFLCICMHIVCACGRTDAERNGTERRPPHRSRETGYKHLPITRLLRPGSGVSTSWSSL